MGLKVLLIKKFHYTHNNATMYLKTTTLSLVGFLLDGCGAANACRLQMAQVVDSGESPFCDILCS